MNKYNEPYVEQVVEQHIKSYLNNVKNVLLKDNSKKNINKVFEELLNN